MVCEARDQHLLPWLYQTIVLLAAMDALLENSTLRSKLKKGWAARPTWIEGSVYEPIKDYRHQCFGT